MVYVCVLCNETFLNLNKYERHMNNKKTCDPIKRETQKINELTCQYCTKVLSNKTRLKGHVEICKNKQNDNLTQVIDLLHKQIENQEKQIEKQDRQNELIKQQMEVIMNKESKTININNTVNQQQNIFNIVPFGKEKFDYITKEEFNEIFEHGFRCLQTLIPLIYCNENNPENMNVYISNFNDNTIRIFNGKDWIIEKKDYVLTNMYNSKRDFLELKFEDMYDGLSKNAKYFFKRFKAGNTDQETIGPILDEIKNILYSNRHNVIKKPAKNIKMIKDIVVEKKPKKKIQIKENINDPDYIPEKPMFF